MREEDAENGAVGRDDCAVHKLVAGMPERLEYRHECNIEFICEQHFRECRRVLEHDGSVVVADERTRVEILHAADSQAVECWISSGGHAMTGSAATASSLRYHVSRATGSRPASRIAFLSAAMDWPIGVTAPAM